MLTLTGKSVTLLAESGESTTIPPSGYAARVESMRIRMGDAPFYQWRVADNHNGHYEGISIYEEATKRIVVDLKPDEMCPDGVWPLDYDIIDAAAFCMYGQQGIGRDEMLLVTREVAQAAAFLAHPLEERMVWADAPEYNIGKHGRLIDTVRGYRELRRMP
jgi:hypothetical protein